MMTFTGWLPKWFDQCVKKRGEVREVRLVENDSEDYPLASSSDIHLQTSKSETAIETPANPKSPIMTVTETIKAAVGLGDAPSKSTISNYPLRSHR